MAGRWVMSTIQMVFAIQPALVYWIAGQSFVTAATRSRSAPSSRSRSCRRGCCSRSSACSATGADVEASLALFDRIFEYLDLPIDIVEAEHPVELRPDEVLGEVRFEGVSFRYAADGDETVDARGHRPRRSGGDADGGRGGDGRGQDDARLPRRAAVRAAEGRVTIDGVDVRDASLESLAATVGVVSQETYLFHASVRENLRFARPGRDRRGDRGRRADRADPRPDRLAARGLRHGRRRARLPLLRRREAADGDRADDPAQPAGARARRGDELARHPDRGGGPGRARAARARDARRSRSRTGSRPCATPTRSSCSTRGGSSSAARTRSCSSAAVCTRRWSRATSPRRRWGSACGSCHGRAQGAVGRERPADAALDAADAAARARATTEAPVGIAEQQHHRRHEHRADDRGVEQHRARQADAEQLDDRARRRARTPPNTSTMIAAAAVIVRPVAASPWVTASGCRRRRCHSS